MNTLEAIIRRKSTRSFNEVQIEEKDLDTIIKAGCASPVSMAKYDSLHITVVQNEKLIARIFDEAEEAVFETVGIRKSLNYGAKTLIIVSSLPPHREGTDYTNAGIVIENMVIAATDIGIDSCIMGAPIAALAKNEELSKLIGIPNGFNPILGAVFGYASEDTCANTHEISVNRI